MTNPSERYAHTSRAIAGCICNGCLRLEVLTERRRHVMREKFYCRDKQHGYFDPRKVDDCELHEDEFAAEKPRPFNSWHKL